MAKQLPERRPALPEDAFYGFAMPTRVTDPTEALWTYRLDAVEGAVPGSKHDTPWCRCGTHAITCGHGAQDRVVYPISWETTLIGVGAKDQKWGSEGRAPGCRKLAAVRAYRQHHANLRSSRHMIA
jgi:hypothetical protein